MAQNGSQLARIEQPSQIPSRRRADTDELPEISRLTKILILSGLRVWPVASGGQLRTSGIACALARMGYDVLVYSLTGRRADYRGYRPWRTHHVTEHIEARLCEETYLGVVPALAHAVSRYRHHPRSWMLSKTKRGDLPRRLRQHIAGSAAVIADHSYISPCRESAADSRQPWYLISHQLEHQLLSQGNAADRRFAPTMEAHERNAFRLFTDVFACAETDQSYFRDNDTTGSMAVPIIRCGVDSTRYAWTEAARVATRAQLGISAEDTVVLFAGSRYEPNNEALAQIKVFAARERGFLESQRIRFLVLGSMEPNAYNEGVLIATGRVPEVLPYFAAADAGLNPITRGAGANVKLFEYLAAKLPVLSTAFGVRGAGLVADEDYVEFDMSTLRDTLHRLVSQRTRNEWKAVAADVWERHRHTIEIDSSVRVATGLAQHFPLP